MKKFLLSLAAACMLLFSAQAAHAQSIAPDPLAQDILMPNTPYDDVVLGVYNAWTGYDFTSLDAVLYPTGGFPYPDYYGHISNVKVTMYYTPMSGGPVISMPLYLPLVPVSGGYKGVHASFSSIIPFDGYMQIVVSAHLADGIMDDMDMLTTGTSVTGHNATGMAITSPMVNSRRIYFDEVIHLGIVSNYSQTITEMPKRAVQFGPFKVYIRKDMTIDTWELIMSGSLYGNLPELVDPRIVDASGNLVAGTFGHGTVMSLSNPTGTPQTASEGDILTVYVLSDILGAFPNEGVQVAIKQVCGRVDPFATVPYATYFCSEKPSPLSGKVIYQPATGIADLAASSAPHVYPTNVSEKFTVALPGKKWDARITGIDGKVVKTLSGFGTEQVSRDGIPSGMYMVSLTTDTEQETFKVFYN